MRIKKKIRPQTSPRKRARKQLHEINQRMRELDKLKRKALMVANPHNLPQPATRWQEILRMLIDAKEPISYYDIAQELNNINGHKARQYWEERGVKFRKIVTQFRNRFNRESEFIKLQLVNKRAAIAAYRKDFLPKSRKADGWKRKRKMDWRKLTRAALTIGIHN